MYGKCMVPNVDVVFATWITLLIYFCLQPMLFVSNIGVFLSVCDIFFASYAFADAVCRNGDDEHCRFTDEVLAEKAGIL